MKIVKVPTDYDYENMQNVYKNFKQVNPEEEVIVLTEDIEVIELPLRDLYRLRDMIDKEISDREMMIPDERNKS